MTAFYLFDSTPATNAAVPVDCFPAQLKNVSNFLAQFKYKNLPAGRLFWFQITSRSAIPGKPFTLSLAIASFCNSQKYGQTWFHLKQCIGLDDTKGWRMQPFHATHAAWLWSFLEPDHILSRTETQKNLPEGRFFTESSTGPTARVVIRSGGGYQRQPRRS